MGKATPPGFQLEAGQDFTRIKSIRLFFSQIIGREPLIAAMNETYGGRIPFLTEMYVDTKTQTALKASAYIDLRQALVAYVTKIASHTTDTTRIKTIMDKWQLLVVFNSLITTLYDRVDSVQELGDAMKKHCDDQRGDCFIIFAGLRQFFVRPDEMVTFYNFDDFDAKPFNTTIINSVATNTGSTIASGASMATGSLFNYKALPLDVQKRYMDFSTGSDYIRKQNLSPYKIVTTINGTQKTSYTKYHEDAHDMSCFILRDGRRFVAMSNIDSRQLAMNPPRLSGTQPHEKRKWYETFCKHCLQYGVYVHPWLLFEKDHGGFTGFECSDTPSGDLPQRLETYIQTCSLELSRLLGVKGMFPEGSEYFALLGTHYGKGHVFLRAFIEPDHPSFKLSPRLMIKSFPTQEPYETIMSFWNRFDDHLKLCALINDEYINMGDFGTQDVFIDNCLDAIFFASEARRERGVRTLAHKFQADAIVNTIISYTSLPDYRPNRRNTIVPHTQKYLTRYQNAKTGTALPVIGNVPKSLKSLYADASAELDMVVNAIYTSTILDEDKKENNILQMESLPLDENAIDPSSYARYFATVNKVAGNPQLARCNPCLVCGELHTFDNCPVLKNNDFLKGHYIKFLSFLKRDMEDRRKQTESLPPILTPDRIKALNLLTGSIPDDTQKQDFRQGRE
jgi:hypothetical protein